MNENQKIRQFHAQLFALLGQSGIPAAAAELSLELALNQVRLAILAQEQAEAQERDGKEDADDAKHQPVHKENQ